MNELKINQQQFIMELMEERKLIAAQIDKLEAEAAATIAEIGAQQGAQQLERFNGMVELLRGRNDLIKQRMELMSKQMEIQNASRESAGPDANGGGLGGVAAASLQQAPAAMGGGMSAVPNGAMG